MALSHWMALSYVIFRPEVSKLPVNIHASWALWSLSQLIHSSVVVGKKQKTVHEQVSVAEFQ